MGPGFKSVMPYAGLAGMLSGEEGRPRRHANRRRCDGGLENRAFGRQSVYIRGVSPATPVAAKGIAALLIRHEPKDIGLLFVHFLFLRTALSIPSRHVRISAQSSSPAVRGSNVLGSVSM